MPGGVEINRTLKILVLTAAPVIALDQITKALILRSMFPGQMIKIVSGLFDLVYFQNQGAAFGILNDGGVLRTAFLVGTSVIALAVIGYLLKGSKNSVMTFSLSLVAGGAVGNLIDRARFGYVVDFLYFHIGPYYWPAFNVADSAITVGVILAIFIYYFKSPN